jgi:hypothetical protein
VESGTSARDLLATEQGEYFGLNCALAVGWPSLFLSFLPSFFLSFFLSFFIIT